MVETKRFAYQSRSMSFVDPYFFVHSRLLAMEPTVMKIRISSNEGLFFWSTSINAFPLRPKSSALEGIIRIDDLGAAIRHAHAQKPHAVEWNGSSKWNGSIATVHTYANSTMWENVLIDVLQNSNTPLELHSNPNQVSLKA